jgi:hypothetical protein
MKKNLLIFLIASFSYLLGSAQVQNEVTVLYLLPFHLNESIDDSSIKNSTEIHQKEQFEMMGFWLGAKMALQEYENSNKRINVIVRDVVTDVNILNKILSDSALMSRVNIMIGPFYGSLFPIAAEFAKKHNIVIVNPFSTRFDFVEHNPSVYKLVPPLLSRPKTIAKVFLSQPNEYNVILWGDSTVSIELQVYKNYFSAHNISYKEVNTLTLPHNPQKTNLIIAFFEQPTRVIHCVHSLINNDMENNVIVAPEKWLHISELTEDFFNLPHLYYFTNYFVDKNSNEVKQFQSDHILFYDAPAELGAYSYQGYDITRYFIDLHFVDYNFDEVTFAPLSYLFQWKQILNGGFENQKVRFIQIKDLRLEEVRVIND